MKRYLRYIFLALIATFMTASCIEEMQFEQPVIQNDELALVPRVKSFANEYVTKATAYDDNEKIISSLAVLIFNSDGNLVHIQEAESVSSVKLNKSMLNTTAQKDKLSSATVVMIANISLDDIKKPDDTSIRDNKANLTLADMENYTCHFEEGKTVITSFGDDFTGFPMIGGVKGVDLTPTRSQQSAIEVGMKILYAKINFSIGVAAGDENTGTGMQFSLSGYSVHNTSQATSLAIPASKGQVDGATTSTAYEYKSDEGAAGSTTGTATLGGTPITFTFYVSESRYNHNSDLKGIYPSDDWLISSTNAYDEDVKGYTSMSDADKAANPLNGVKYYYDDIIQQYKPKLATVSTGKPASGLATYVLLNGTYTDYRGATWTVNYKVYLGKDNAHNFHVDRNSIYTNNITIKGIRNNDSFLDKDENGAVVEGGDQYVWIDHRVNVTDASDHANHVSITRETLIDSHIEVRPLRVSLPADIDRAWIYLPKYNGSQVEELDDNVSQNWIAIENNNGRVKDATKYCSNGKRKYFTTALIDELYLENNDEKYGVKTNSISGDSRNGQKFIQLFDGDCAWIYIDENASESSRTAVLEVVFIDSEGAVVAVETLNIVQSGLKKVGNSDIYIESYEEYLHTYDSQDIYTDPTKDYTQQGYKWGLDGKRLSTSQTVTSINRASDTYLYDYFHTKDHGYNSSYSVLGGNVSDNYGLNFTNNAGISQNMTIIDMGTRPESAIQYCLSKNKFNVDESDEEKHTMDIHWYLPDVYQMSELLSEGQNEFPDFKNNAYWTSQPSWTSELFGTYLSEDTDNARSVSLDGIASSTTYQGTNASRNEQHRIRCAYSTEGLTGVDFSGDRAPDGIGAMRFYMKAWKDWDSRDKGYFNWLLADDESVTNHTLPTYAYPKDASHANQYFGAYLDGYGFEEDPSDSDNWDTETVSIYTSQIALYTWPGLTDKIIVENNTLMGNNVYYTLSEDYKEGSVGSTTTHFTKYTGDITTESLKYLDYMIGSSDLSITFSKNSDATNAPAYSYYKIKDVVDNKTTYKWNVPVYSYKENTSESSEYTLYESNAEYWRESDAKSAGEAKAKEYSEYSNVKVKTERPFLRYKYIITYTDYKKYYYCFSDGYWTESGSVEKTTPNSDQPTDQLVMYGGNSFTITASNGYEISSVKVYFSDSNVVDEVGRGHDYLRFTKDGWIGNTDAVPPGMVYSGNGDTGTMTWSGDAMSSVTLKLIRYQDVYSSSDILGLGEPESFRYLSNSDDTKSHSIVIDQIDVRYKKTE